MRANVLSDPALMKHAGRFAWLSIDTEKSENEAFVEKFPIDTWPTFFVIDPGSQRAVFKWMGTANVGELEKLFEDGELALRTSSGKAPEELLAMADRANAEGNRLDAAKLYREALQKAPAQWDRRPRTIESLVMVLQGARSREDCAQAALKAVPTMPRGSSFANTAAVGLACAVQAPKDAAWRPAAISGLEPWVRNALDIPDLLADDRSGLYEVLVLAAESAGDKERVTKLAAAWLTFLEAEAARARTPEARAAFDSHRVAAAMKLGDPARAISALQASEKDLPNDYNPPARLALLYSQLGRQDEALSSADRALARAYGPRRIGIYQTKAKVYLNAGDHAAAQRTLLEGLRYAQSLPKTEQSEKAIARLQKAIDGARQTAAAKTR